MSSIDIELATLHARIAELEKMNKPVPKVKTLEDIRDEVADQLTKKYSNSVPLARYYDQLKLELIKATLDSLQKINGRLDALEKTCERCGRYTHCAETCFAQRHLKGHPLK